MHETQINETVSDDEHIHSFKILSLNLSVHEFSVLSSFYAKIVSVYNLIFGGCRQTLI